MKFSNLSCSPVYLFIKMDLFYFSIFQSHFLILRYYLFKHLDIKMFGVINKLEIKILNLYKYDIQVIGFQFMFYGGIHILS